MLSGVSAACAASTASVARPPSRATNGVTSRPPVGLGGSVHCQRPLNTGLRLSLNAATAGIVVDVAGDAPHLGKTAGIEQCLNPFAGRQAAAGMLPGLCLSAAHLAADAAAGVQFCRILAFGGAFGAHGKGTPGL